MGGLRAGQLVRYVGTAIRLGNGDLIPSDNHGHVGTILGYYDQDLDINGNLVNFYLTDLDDCVYAETNLIPINPDNEAFGSWEDMINSLTTEKVE